MIAILTTLALSSPALAQSSIEGGVRDASGETAAQAEEFPMGEAGYYIGARGGVAVPIDGRGLAWPVSLEAGLEFPSDVSLGLRMTFQVDPPDVMGIASPDYALGPVIDGRYFYRATRNVDLYPTVGLGFLFGVADDGENVVLPVATGGVGARMRLGGSPIYIAPEVGVTNFMVPYMGLAIGHSVPPRMR